MDELKAVKAAVNPDEILLVVDAMTGQDAVSAAKTFDDIWTSPVSCSPSSTATQEAARRFPSRP